MAVITPVWQQERSDWAQVSIPGVMYATTTYSLR